MGSLGQQVISIISSLGSQPYHIVTKDSVDAR